MNIKRMVLLGAGIALCGATKTRAQSNWTGSLEGTTNITSRDYLTNWSPSRNDSFAGKTLTGDLTLFVTGTFGAPNGMNFDYSGDFTMTLQSNNTSTRQVFLGGDVSFNPTGATERTLNLNYIVLNMNGANRRFDIGTGQTMTYANANIVGTGLTLIKTGGGIMQHSSGSGMAFNVQVDEGEYRFGTNNRLGGSVTIESNGTLNLNTFSQTTARPLILNGGVLTGVGGSFVTSALGLTSTGGGDVTFAGAGFLTLGGTLTYNSGAPNKTLTFTGGELRLSATREFAVANGSQAIDVDVAAAVTGAGFGVTKTGAGVMRVSGVNTYTGTTAVNAGTLVVGDGGSINSSSGVTVGAGGSLFYNSSTALTVAPTLSGSAGSRARLGGSGTINAALTLNDVGDVLSPGNSPGILTFGTSQSWSSHTYEWEANDWTGTTAGTHFDQITITGGLTLSGTTGSYALDILSLTGANVSGNVPNFSETNRSWTILTTTGGITGFNASYWTLNTAGFTNPFTGSWSVSNVGNDLNLNYIAAAATNLNWLGGTGGPGTWEATGGTNWSGGPWNATKTATFAGTAGTVTVAEGGVAANSGLEFNVGGYTLAGAAITLGGADAAANTISTAAGTTTINAPLAGSAGLTKAGPGTLVLGGANTFSGGATVSAGTLSVSADSNLGDAAGGISLGGGTLEFTSSFTLGSSRTITALASTTSTLAVTSGTVSFAGAFTGSGNLDKTGVGRLVVSNSSSGYTGLFTVSAGTLEVTGANAFANGTLRQTGGDLLLAPVGGGDVTIPDLDGSGGTTTIAENVTAVVGGTANSSYNGQIRGQGGLRKEGSGDLQLNGDNDFAGTTRIAAGRLALGANGALSATPLIEIDSEAIFDVTAKTGGFVLGTGQRLGGQGTVLGNLQFGSGSLLTLDPTAPNSPLLIGSGTISFAEGFGIANIFGLDGTTPLGVYTLLNETTGGGINFANLANATQQLAFDLGGVKRAYFQQGSLQVVVFAVPEPSTVLLAGLGLAFTGWVTHRRRQGIGRR